MADLEVEHLEKIAVGNYNLGNDTVRFISQVKRSMNCLMTDVTVNDSGDFLYSWDAHSDKKNQYAPPLRVMTHVQDEIGPVLRRHIRDGQIDKHGLIKELGIGGIMGS